MGVSEEVSITVTIRVFVADRDRPTDLGKTAIGRANAAASRFQSGVEAQVLALDSPEAAALGAAIEPTTAVGDLVIAVGQPPLAGHVVRAIQAAMDSDT